MAFKFTEKDLEQASESKMFNGGKAGVAKNLRVWMEEAGVDGVPDNANANAPKFKVYFEDENGAKTNKACFDIKESEFPDMYNRTYEDTLKKEWAYLNKIVEHTGGVKVFDFTDDTDLFRKVKTAIGTEKVNIFVNYGSVNSPKEFLEPRKWLPAVEPAGTSNEDSKLKPGRIDNLNAPVADSAEKAEENFF